MILRPWIICFYRPVLQNKIIAVGERINNNCEVSFSSGFKTTFE